MRMLASNAIEFRSAYYLFLNHLLNFREQQIPEKPRWTPKTQTSQLLGVLHI